MSMVLGISLRVLRQNSFKLSVRFHMYVFKPTIIIIIIIITAKPLWTTASLHCGHGGYRRPSSYEETFRRQSRSGSTRFFVVTEAYTCMYNTCISLKSQGSSILTLQQTVSKFSYRTNQHIMGHFREDY